jgi:hypothetical protein
MGWLALVIAAAALLVAAVLSAILFRDWRRQRSAAIPAQAVVSPGDEAKRLHAETALSELRHMREALAPAAHNRVERRRNPQPGTAPKIERRKKGVRRQAVRE